MVYLVWWAHYGGDQGVGRFATEEEANEAARTVKGTGLVSREPAGSVAVFRHGRELRGAEASDAILRFRHRIEVGIPRPEDPETNIDPDDTTGSGWRPGTPAVWGWRVWKGEDRPTPWVGTYWSREAAHKAAAEARAAAERGHEGADPGLAGLPIVDIGPVDTE